MELADQQNAENSGAVADAEIPTAPEDTASPPETPSKAEKPLSIREQLNKSIETVRTEEAKRARDLATGKFTKTDAEIPKPATDAKPEASPAEGPPSAWKSIWDSMTPEARAIAVKRESEVSKGFDEYRNKVKQFESLEQVLAPARARFQQQGIQSDAEAIRNIISWEQGLHDPTTRVAAFRSLAQQLGVDLSQLVQNPSQVPSQGQEIPAPFQPVLDQFGNSLSAVQQEIQALRNERVSQELSAFAKDKPHFEKVSVLMGQLMSAGAARDLESAYQQATKIHPEVSAQIEADRITKEAAEREKTQAEKAAAARRAAVSPAGRSPNGIPVNGGAASKSGLKPRESILAAIAELREGQRA